MITHTTQLARQGFTLIACAFIVSALSNVRATELTFNIAGFFNFSNMSQDYGDKVTAATMGDFSYGIEGGFTPNVSVSYGPDGADPAFWTTGYGDLTNVLFEYRDSFGTLEVTFAADPGFEVNLHRWEMASYSSAFSQDPTPQIS
jgi:hypothetical protein